MTDTEASVGDWVGESSVDSGTGRLKLEGPLDGHAGFVDIGNDIPVWYAIINGNNKESGIGHIVGDYFYRDEIHTTLTAEALDNTDPSPLYVSGSSQIYSTFNAAAFEQVSSSSRSTGAISESRDITESDIEALLSISHGSIVGTIPHGLGSKGSVFRVYSKGVYDLSFSKIAPGANVFIIEMDGDYSGASDIPFVYHGETWLFIKQRTTLTSDYWVAINESKRGVDTPTPWPVPFDDDSDGRKYGPLAINYEWLKENLGYGRYDDGGYWQDYEYGLTVDNNDALGDLAHGARIDLSNFPAFPIGHTMPVNGVMHTRGRVTAIDSVDYSQYVYIKDYNSNIGPILGVWHRLGDIGIDEHIADPAAHPQYIADGEVIEGGAY